MIFHKYLQQKNLKKVKSIIEKLSDPFYKSFSYPVLFHGYIEIEDWINAEYILEKIKAIPPHNPIHEYKIRKIFCERDSTSPDFIQKFSNSVWTIIAYTNICLYLSTQFLSIELALQYARNADFEKAKELLDRLPYNKYISTIKIELAQAYARKSNFRGQSKICKALPNQTLYHESCELIFSIAYQQKAEEILKKSDLCAQYEKWKRMLCKNI